MDFIRTPDERFKDLVGFPYTPRFATVTDGLRMAYIDEGPATGRVVLLLHGEPTWSYLYRKMIPVLVEGGLRAVVPDLIGFGRSDKPTARDSYSYARHVEWVRSFIAGLHLSGLTLFGQDWGGLIGLRLVAEHTAWFDRVVAANTFLPTGDQPMPPAFFRWQEFSQQMEPFSAGWVVAGGCARPVDEAAMAAYDAPFPDERYLAGARQFPMLVPSRPDDPASQANREAWEELKRFGRPFLTAFGDKDPITGAGAPLLQSLIPGAAGQPHTTIADAGHFIQEDAGEELAALIVRFVHAR